MTTPAPNPSPPQHTQKKVKPRVFSRFLLTPLMSLFVKFLPVWDPALFSLEISLQPHLLFVVLLKQNKCLKNWTRAFVTHGGGAAFVEVRRPGHNISVESCAHIWTGECSL